jgi:hypothetical protein
VDVTHPGVYHGAVLGLDEPAPRVSDDPYCLGQVKHYRSHPMFGKYTTSNANGAAGYSEHGTLA